MAERVPFGIEGLDAAVGGGFPRGSLILLAGNPGAGKTVFSTQFLYKGAASGEPGVYVSFAEDKDLLIRHASSHLGCDLEGLEKDGKLRVLDLATMKGEGVSASLELVVREIASIGAKRLVIDSFSAMAQAFEEPLESRIIIHTVLGKIVRKMGCTTVLIVEVPLGGARIGLGVEEFAADGVIVLKAGEFDGRLLRELELVKLRGIELKERKLVFTLKDGFEVFPPFKPKPVGKTGRFQPIPDPPDRFSTGSEDLDEMLGGGYPKGGGVLLEIAEKIATLEYHLFVVSTAMNFLAQGRGVITIPTAGVDAELIKKRLMEYGATEDEINRLLKVCEARYPGTDQSKPYAVVFDGKGVEKDYAEWLRIEDELMRETGQPALSITGLDALANLYGPEACGRILSLDATRMRSHDTMAVVITKPGYEDLAKKLSAQAETHLKLTREHGALLVYGVKPRTGLCAVETDTSKGYAMPKLTPIV